jgi:hypothetical protein
MIPAEKQKEFDILKSVAIRFNSNALANLVHYIETPHALVPAFNSMFNVTYDIIYALFRLPQYWDSHEERLFIFCQNTIWLNANYPYNDASSYRKSFIRLVVS